MTRIKECFNIVYRHIVYPLYRKLVNTCFTNGKLPFVYRFYLLSKERQINSRSCDISFIFLSDIHWGANHQLSPLIIGHLVKNTCIKHVFSGGDVITHSDGNRDKMFSLWADFSHAFSFWEDHFYQIYGNHDNNSYQQRNENAIFTREEIMNCQGIGDGIRFGDMFSFYVDDYDSKTRFLCLDTGKQYLEERDLVFISETLKCTPPNWHIIVLSHLIIEWMGSRYQARPYIKKLCELFDRNNKSGNSKIEVIMAGHVHNDYHTTTEGGIPIITVGSDAYGVACGKYKKSIRPFHEQCVNVIQIDYSNNHIYGTRIGRGDDFCYSLTKVVL